MFEDFFQIIHVRNTGTLFSLGSRWSLWKNLLFLKIFPLILIIWITLVISIPYELYRKIPILRWIPYEKFDTKSRWTLAIVIGGGLGNIIDRFFRTHGVIDFLDFKFYGIFGLERWPTFNVADVSVIIGMSLLILISITSSLSQKIKFQKII